MSATADLLDFAAAAHALPRQVCADAERLLADTLSVGAAGATAPGAEGVRRAASAWGAAEEARLIGSPQRLPAPSAAFANGFRIHCLEWDAVHESAVVHALSVVTAALLAASDRRGGSSQDEALTALAVGVDIASGLGIAADSALSFFRPATAGCIGAALAVARLEGIARAQLPDVLGLAYSFCAGTMQAHVEGSIALPLQIANAARAAISAVDLVKAGLTGPHDALEGPFGYYTLFDEGNLARYTATLGSVWRISVVSTKPYPSGRASHAVLSTLAELRSAGTIAHVETHVPPLIARLVDRPAGPGMTPAYARLCLPLLVELMIEDGQINPRRFGDLPAIPADRLRIVVDGNTDPNALSPQRVIVIYADGRRAERVIPHTLGSPEAPFSDAQVRAKRDLARALSPPDADPRIFDSPLAYFTDPQ